jgi:hypothetical protein
MKRSRPVFMTSQFVNIILQFAERNGLIFSPNPPKSAPSPQEQSKAGGIVIQI